MDGSNSKLTIKALRNRVDDKGFNDKILGRKGTEGGRGSRDSFVI
jgi:hypothetical protein